jgi:hypothetical protein
MFENQFELFWIETSVNLIHHRFYTVMIIQAKRVTELSEGHYIQGHIGTGEYQQETLRNGWSINKTFQGSFIDIAKIILLQQTFKYLWWGIMSNDEFRIYIEKVIENNGW